MSFLGWGLGRLLYWPKGLAVLVVWYILTAFLHISRCPPVASPLLSTWTPDGGGSPVYMTSVGSGTLCSPLGPATGEPKRWSKGAKEVGQRVCLSSKVHERWLSLWIKGHSSLQDRLYMSLFHSVLQELRLMPTLQIYGDNWSLSSTPWLVHHPMLPPNRPFILCNSLLY